MSVATHGFGVLDEIRKQEQVSKHYSSVLSASTLASWFLPSFSSCLDFFYDDLWYGSVNKINPLFLMLFFIAVFHYSNNNPT